MVSTIFNDILKQAAAAGVDAKVISSRAWFRKKAQEFTKINVTEFFRENQDRYRTVVQMGNLYCFYYDPKHKATLPYYDLVPIIFPLDIQKDHILGINFHYLPPTLRAQLMDALYKHVTSKTLSDTAKMQITYGILKSAAEFPLVKPCIKKYLKPHIRSRFIKIKPSEWDTALFLGIDKFQKKGRGQVWADSKAKINGSK